MKTLLFLLLALPLFAEIETITVQKDLSYRAQSEDGYQIERYTLVLYQAPCPNKYKPWTDSET